MPEKCAVWILRLKSPYTGCMTKKTDQDTVSVRSMCRKAPILVPKLTMAQKAEAVSKAGVLHPPNPLSGPQCPPNGSDYGCRKGRDNLIGAMNRV